MKLQEGSVVGDKSQMCFYLILNEAAEIESDDDLLAQEIDDIDRLSRIAHDVMVDEHPRFMTST
ncbi:MAG: hypothetical protein ACREQ5_10240 [Candidatus Dormibacteria bacterium]